MTEIKRFKHSDAELSGEANSIRTRVFVNELHVPQELEYDEYDEISQHYLMYSGGKPVATARWRKTGEGIKLERFAMLAAFRNKGLGTILLNAVMEDVKIMGLPIYLNAQLTAINYYKRSGFSEVGERFEEAGIMHCRMDYNPEHS